MQALRSKKTGSRAETAERPDISKFFNPPAASCPKNTYRTRKDQGEDNGNTRRDGRKARKERLNEALKKRFPPKEVVDEVKKKYVPDTRVELVKSEDRRETIKLSSKGTVKFVDNSAIIQVLWDGGRGCGASYGEDECRIIDK